MNSINGYLEFNGSITRIKSMDDIELFVRSVKDANDCISEEDFVQMTRVDENAKDTFFDDCGCEYVSEPQTLLVKKKVGLSSYKVLDGTIAIADSACGVERRISHRSEHSIHKILIPNSVVAIGWAAFINNSHLSEIRFSNSLVFIGGKAFYGCRRLCEIDIPNSIKYIRENAFENSGLTNIVLPASLVVLGSHVFKDCAELEKVVFNGMPNEIGSGVFDGCDKLNQIIIPKGTSDYFVKQLYPVAKEIIFEH